MENGPAGNLHAGRVLCCDCIHFWGPLLPLGNGRAELGSGAMFMAASIQSNHACWLLRGVAAQVGGCALAAGRAATAAPHG